MSEIATGNYKPWAPLIMHWPQLMPGFASFPLHTPAFGMPIDGQTILYADHDRWSRAARGK